jgi:hypothetical protein
MTSARRRAKPQSMRPKTPTAKWIFHQEKSTFSGARKGHSDSGFALVI